MARCRTGVQRHDAELCGCTGGTATGLFEGERRGRNGGCAMTPGTRWIQMTGTWLGLLAGAGCHDARTTLAAGAPAADRASGAAIEQTVVLNQQMLNSISIETVQEREQPRTLNVGGRVQF